MSQLTQEQRYTISEMYQSGYKQVEIARVIKKDKSVICRELKRNADGRSGQYRYTLAIRKAAQRQREKRKRCSFTAEIQAYVEANLALKLSPEQIAGVAKKECAKCVSPERIYQHIWSDKRKKGTLYKHLRSKGKKYKDRGLVKDKRGQILGRVDIRERPSIVEKRERFGDLEIDTIIGRNHKGAILTINDRASGMLKMKKLNSRNASELAQACIDTLQAWKPYIKTITSDNGKEFSEHLKIANELSVKFYFARPYHSWERGSNENLNGLIRQYIPKKSDFSSISDDFVNFVEEQLNLRPRKRFNFVCPFSMFNHKVAFIS